MGKQGKEKFYKQTNKQTNQSKPKQNKQTNKRTNHNTEHKKTTNVHTHTSHTHTHIYNQQQPNMTNSTANKIASRQTSKHTHTHKHKNTKANNHRTTNQTNKHNTGKNKTTHTHTHNGHMCSGAHLYNTCTSATHKISFASNTCNEIKYVHSGRLVSLCRTTLEELFESLLSASEYLIFSHRVLIHQVKEMLRMLDFRCGVQGAVWGRRSGTRQYHSCCRCMSCM